MSKKRKTNSKKPAVSIKPTPPGVTMVLDEYISANRSAELTSGEELRNLLIGLIYSKRAMLNYISSIGLSREPLAQVLSEMKDLEKALNELPFDGLEYLKALLIDNTKLKQALDIASKLIDLNLRENKSLLKA